MPGAYGVGPYGEGNYSASTAYDGAAVVPVLFASSATWLRVRSGKSLAPLSFSQSAAGSADFSGSAVEDVGFGSTGWAKVVYVLRGSATVDVEFGVFANANYITSRSAEVALEIGLQFDYFAGKYWDPENIPTQVWTPETLTDGIWVAEPIPSNPWG